MLAQNQQMPTTAELDSIGDRTWQTYSRGDLIPLPSSGMWQVCRGWVQLSTFSIDGRERVLGWLGSSMWLGEMAKNNRGYQAKALSEVKLVWYSGVEIEASPQLRATLMPQLAWRQRQLLNLLTVIQHRRVEDRLRHLIKLLKQEMGQPVPEGTKIGVRLTHLDIANSIGTCRVSVTRILAQFQEQGLIAWDRKRHLIVCEEAEAVL